MKKLLKKTTAILMAVALLMSSSIAAFAAQEGPEEAHIGLREFFEAQGGTVEWDGPNRRITANLEDDNFVMYPTTTRAYRNNESVTLNRPVYIIDGTAFIELHDLMILFGIVEAGEPGHLGLTTATFAEAIPAFIEQVGAVGVTVALVDAHAGFTWVQGFGYADSVAGVPVDGDTIFQLASISKPFTAIAVMQLVEAGVINLDEPITTYLPEFSLLPDVLTGTADYSNVTVRMLLSHASGIMVDFLSSGVFTYDDYYPGFMDNFLENIAGFPMAIPESYMFSYANNAFTLLGILVATMATEYDSVFEGFVSYMQENVLDAAGMELSTFQLTDRHWPHVAESYISRGVREDFVFFNALPTGGLMSTANDMARFMHVVLNQGALPTGGRLLSAGTMRQMLTPQQFDLASGLDLMLPNMHPGIGFIHSTGITGFTHAGHGGNLIHFHSDMAFDLDSGIGVFVSANSVESLGWVSALSVEILMTAVFEKTGGLNLPASDPTVEPVEMAFEDLQALEGIYSVVGGQAFARAIASEEGHLYLHNFIGIPTMTLVPLSDGSFVCAEAGLRIWFYEVEGEHFILLGEFGSLLLGLPLNLEEVAAPEWLHDWVGTYVAQFEPGLTSNVVSVTVSIDETGIGYMRVATRNLAGGISPIIAAGDGYQFIGGQFSADEYGDWLHMADGRFLRVE